MKLYLIAAMLLIGISTSAQVVNIPDPAFKAYLVGNPSINTNGDNEIQITEALQVQGLGIMDNAITDVTGIRSFANLQYLAFALDSIDIIDLSDMDELIEVDFGIPNFLFSVNLSGCTKLNGSIFLQNCHLSTLNVAGCANLEDLSCPYNNLSALDLTDCVNLKFLKCHNNNITMLDLTNCIMLKNLDCSNNRITNINVGLMDSLTSVNFNYNLLSELDLRNCPNVITLYCDLNQISLINISGLSKLTDFNSLSNPLSQVDVSGCSSLTNIMLEMDSQPVNVNVSGCVALEALSIFGNSPPSLRQLDLSTCPNLKSLDLSFIDTIDVNLKNGSALTNWNFEAPWGTGQNVLCNICADDFELDTLQASLINLPFLTFNISSYCSFFPGGHYNTIKGKARLDLNGNGCNPADAEMPSVPVRMTDASGASVIRYTFFNGAYAHYPYAGNFTLTPYFPNPYFTIAPASANITFDTANSLIDSANFCIAPSGIFNDLEINLLPVTPARPGFDAGYQLIYKNRGTTTLSGALQLNFDNGKMNFISASTGVSSQSAGQLVWNYANLQPFQHKSIDITFNLLPPPVNNINDTLIYLAAINPAANDETPNDNSFVLPQAVTGSYDPNDKECLEGSKIALTDIDKPLHYIIHFQNLGTDTAFNIVVADTLSNKLDWNSFEFTGSSHTCNVQQRNGKMEFFFQNINLPHSSINEPASHGFVAFKIKPKADVIIGDSINNRAAIYFDFNPPVITNMATTVVSPVGPVPVRLEYFSAAAKGNTNILNWKASCSNGSSTFNIERSTDGIHFMKIGNITATHTRCQLPFNYIDEQPLTGKNFYRIKITDPDGISFYSKVLVVGNNKQDLEIVAISGNRENTMVYLDASKQQTIQLKIIAADGKLIYSSRKTIPPGRSQIGLQLKNVARGVYTLLVSTKEGELITKRFIK